MNNNRNLSWGLGLYWFVCRVVPAFLALGILLGAVPAQAQITPPYPVIFIHGILADASTWKELRQNLEAPAPIGKNWTYGGSPIVDPASGVVGTLDKLVAADFYTLQFSSNHNLTLPEQGGELGLIIKAIVAANVAVNPAKNRVILVAHSMGGLAARAYLEGFAKTKQGYLPYNNHDVAQLITVGTPHQGSLLPDFCQMNLGTQFDCFYFFTLKNTDFRFVNDEGAHSVAMESLKPQGADLRAINLSVNDLPIDVLYASIIVGGTKNNWTNFVYGDGVVTEDSQNLGSPLLKLQELAPQVAASHTPIAVYIDPNSCSMFGIKKQTHTCETSNPLVQEKIVTEILGTSQKTIPLAITLPPESATISGTNATLNGRIDPVGKSATVWFEWGPIPALGNATPAQTLVAGNNIVPISANLNGLASGTPYYYRVVAQNADGTTNGNIVSFTTLPAGTASLPAPTLLSPAPFAWSQSITPTFSWSPVANAPSYRIMVATDLKALPTDKASSTCPSCAINITSTTPSYVPPAGMLTPGTLYWWQVKGRSAIEYGDWSSQQVFATALAPTVPLPAPTLSAPVGGVTTASATPLMNWSAVAGADSYWIMVADNAADLPTASESLTCPLCSVSDTAYTTSYTPLLGKLVSGVTYYWQATARNATTSGTWSSPVGVFIAGGIPAQSNATCGTAAGGTFTSAPTSNLCTTGTLSAVTGMGPWFWNCSANGHDQGCAANIVTHTVSALATGNGTITPASETISLGSAATFTVVPVVGSKASVSGCGINQGWIASPTLVTTSSITGDCVVTATFSANPTTKYSKICNNGQDAGQGTCPSDPVLGSSATNWACTRDNNNGLLWEMKTTDHGLSDHNNTYSWYDTNPTNNGGSQGTSNGGVCVGSRCDTSGFADAVAATGLCGTNDWRVPTIDELVTLVDAASANNGFPAIDASYFPNTLGAPYWSGTPYNGISTGAFGGTNAAWEMNFFNQYANGTYPRGWPNSVRVVRAGVIGGPFGLTVSLIGNGSVTSNPTGINCGTVCSESLPGGFSVTLSATPAAGFSFTGWSGACTGTATTCTVAMSQYREVAATFSSLAVNGTCGGANGISFPVAPIASLCSTGTASAVAGSGPWNWSCLGSGGGATASCTALSSGTTLPSVPATGFSSGISAGAGIYDITAGPDGNLWFTESRGNRIGRITTGGVVTEFSAGISVGAQPFGITAGPDGNLWFTEASAGRIGRITPSGVVTEFNITVGATPTRITAGPDGNLWFTDIGLAQIGRITPTGVVTVFPVAAGGYAEDITAGPDGNLWFTEFLLNQIGRITPAGIVTEFSSGISANAKPYGITAGPDGSLWFTEIGISPNRIGRITTGGVVAEFSVSQAGHGIAANRDGNIWFMEDGAARIGRITTAGVVTDFNVSNILAERITVGPDGNLWFTVVAHDLIGRVTIDSSGVTTASLSTTSPFSAQVGATSAAQVVTLSNTASAALTITSIVANGDFAQTNGCGTALAAGASCTISVTFTPIAAGPRNGNLTVTSNAIGSPQVVSLGGTGIAVLAPEVSLSTASLSFAAQNIGTTSTTQSVIVTNIGAAVLNLGNFAISGDFGQSSDCSSSVVPGANCSFSVAFTPTATGTRNGALTFTSNAAGSPHNVSLIGTGVAVVLKAQTITFNPLSNRARGQVLAVSASATSSLPVSFSSITPGVCTVSDTTATLIALGTCTIAADQPGNGTYAAAPQVMQSFEVTRLPGDFNGDGHTDLLLHNASTGQTVGWLMNGLTVSSRAGLLTNLNWTVIATPDLNGDGKGDLLWHNAATGQTTAWLMNGLTVSGHASLPTGPDWTIIATPDLNGDGKADLLLHNAATGQTVAWLMDGLTVSARGNLLTDPNWTVIATPDLNGDGKDDLLWYDAATGQSAAWLMNGLTASGHAGLPTGPNWKVIATPDLNGDGMADLVLHNATNGQTVAWLMNGLTVFSRGNLLTDPNWTVIATPDLNGDGKDDLLWYNAATGQTAAWLMNGLTASGHAGLPTGPNWKVIATPDLDGDGKADLLWYNAATGQTVAWLMNGLTASSHASLVSDPKWTATSK